MRQARVRAKLKSRLLGAAGTGAVEGQERTAWLSLVTLRGGCGTSSSTLTALHNTLTRILHTLVENHCFRGYEVAGQERARGQLQLSTHTLPLLGSAVASVVPVGAFRDEWGFY